MNAGFRYETVSETEHGKTCFDRLTDDIVEFVRVGMYFVETKPDSAAKSASRPSLTV